MQLQFGAFSVFYADVPAEKPTLTVDKYRYAAGEQIQANCTSRASYPAANLTWFVNGQQVGSNVWHLMLTYDSCDNVD